MNNEDQINELRSNPQPTLRPTVAALEEVIYKPIPLLDYGFVRLIDYMGDDNAVVQAARVSYGKGTKKINEDRGLIRYLMRHYHTTPFEMCEIKFHIKLPIFIARQWIRHRTANVNEYSARYSVMDKEFYIPEVANLAPQSKINHQGRSTEVLSNEEAARVLEILKTDASRCYRNYEVMMNEDRDGNVIDEGSRGVARELARMNLTLNSYTQWYWKTDLHNLMHFLHLRADSHAQYEIQVYAKAMLEIVKAWVPHSYDAFVEYKANAVHLSATGFEVIKRLLAGEAVSEENSGLSKREYLELMSKFGK
jgi:thymidylate synthase (FAD)